MKTLGNRLAHKSWWEHILGMPWRSAIQHYMLKCKIYIPSKAGEVKKKSEKEQKTEKDWHLEIV